MEDHPMSQATFVRHLSTGFRGDARLYALDGQKVLTKYDGRKVWYTHLVVSAADVFGAPETYIFPANADGTVLDWGELDGSQKGNVSHDEALSDGGYEVN
jgi:hypothetical protein